ncbi:MAG: hypothetical protein ACTSVR_04425 [Candidatus Thorarchaeota archaeon]
MNISNLQYMLDDLKSIKESGGSAYKQANLILQSEATTHNISYALSFIAKQYDKEIK